jgi:putative nucleotidyltransferase with HDIG domain
MVDQTMIDFVKHFIEDRDPIATDLKHRFSFRNRADHCYRCYKWAQRINEFEKGDAEIVEISALFHDIGKCINNTKEGHGEEGAKICEQYLTSVGIHPTKIEYIADIVRNHSYHEKANTLEAQIVSDADLLDETGAMIVLWDSMAVGSEDIQSYTIAYERIVKAYTGLIRRPNRFHTTSGKHFFKERVEFLGEFVGHLEYELGLRN